MPLQYEVPAYKKLRVIVDTDAACEADDPFAIAHALLCKKFDVKAIFAEQFGSPNTTALSFREIMNVVEAMDIDVPVLMGEEGNLSQTAGKEPSEAVKYLVEEALKDDGRPLFVLCMGAITNVAAAMRLCPEIIKRITVVWIGGREPAYPKAEYREFNSGNDIEAANYVVSSGAEIWLIPLTVYTTMNIGLAEIQRRIYPCGKIGKHLFENMLAYNISEGAGWTAGESWSLGDSPAVGVALDQNCGKYIYTEAPVFEEDTSISFKPGRPKIRIYTSINSRFILEDFIAKLELTYGE